MEVLVTLFFIVLIILIVSLRGRLVSRINLLEEEIHRLRKDIHNNLGNQRTVTPPNPPTPAPQTAPPTPPHPKPEAAPEPKFEPLYEPKPEPIYKPKETEPFIPPPTVTQPHVFTRSEEKKPASPPPPPKPGFFERHPDLEKFIGENLVSKIGIAILVLAIGFFVKYAIDNDWIGPVGRVGIGIACGGILAGFAHLLRNNYKAFSSVLVGGGLAVFYFTIALAYHQYQLFGQTASFIIMLVITIFSVVLSLLYDRQELAIIALAGGFITPFLVSNGSGNYIVLFSYLLILNAGLLFIAYRKAWRLLNVLAFGFTTLLFSSWLFTLPDKEPLTTFKAGFIFATTFFILFFLINILHNIKENKKFIASDFGILLANTCLYFGLGLYMLAHMGLTQYQGLFSACMAVLNLGTSYFLFRKKKVDSNILYLLVGITLTFISLTAPIQLHGHYITLFWASESVLLYWLAKKSKLDIIRIAAIIVWGAMLVSLCMDWINVYGIHGAKIDIIFNKGLMTTLYAAICCYLLYFFRPWGAALVIVAGSILLFVGGALEIDHQFKYYYPDTDLYILYLTLYGFAWTSAITYVGSHWRWFSDPIYLSALLSIGILSYIFLTPESYSIQTDLLVSGHHTHFLGASPAN